MEPLRLTRFENCTKCAICTEYCPVSEVNPDFPGPKQAGPDGERLRLKNPDYYDEALKLCTNCKRCEVSCPSRVAIGDIIQLARRRYARGGFSPRDALVSHTDFLGRLAATPLAPLVNAAAAAPPVKKALELTLGLAADRRFPSYAPRTFRHWFERRAAAGQADYPERAAFFHGCYINYNDPGLGRDVVKVLNALEVGVRLLAGERCCGVPLMAGGFFGAARKNALANDRAIARAVGENLRVTVASSTCALTLRDEYPQVLDLDNSLWRGRVVFLTRLLLERLGKTKPALKPLELKAAYHTSCHMERLGWPAYSVALLRLIPGLRLSLLPARCCGLAGTYGFKAENRETAGKIGAGLFAEIEKCDAELIVTECETCRMQIEMSGVRRCVHPVSLLARAF